MRPSKRSILDTIEAHAAEYIAFLQDLIRAPSPNPPGHTVAATAVVRDFLANHGVLAETVAPREEMPNLVADFRGVAGQGPRVILNGHIDTYPAKADDWDHGSPYSGRNDGSHIHGRGGVDMKAGTAASTIAFMLLHQHAKHLAGSVALTVVSDEETGGKWGTRYLIERCGDPSPWKGDVVLNGEPGGLQSIRMGEKGTLRLTFTVETAGANGSYRHLSRGANIVAAQLIQRLLEIESMTPELPEELRRNFESAKVRAAADEIMGKGAADILLVPTVNIGTISGGLKVNMIPEKCVFEADIRLPIGLATDKVMDRIDSILSDFPTVTMAKQDAASNPPNYCTMDHPLAALVEKNAEQVTGRRPVYLAGLGGTDCKFYRYHGVPAYVYGPSPKGMGAKSEAVSIDEFLALIKVHTLAVWDFLKPSADE